MSLKFNIAANYASQLYTTLIGIVLVPWYLRYMGVEAYGLMARLFGWRHVPLFKRNLELEAHGLKARAEALVKA